MLAAAGDGSLLARPKSGSPLRLPQLPGPTPPLATHVRSPLPLRFTTYQPLPTNHAFLIAGEKILKTELTPSVPILNAFLIAGVCPASSPAAAPRISNRYTKLLEIELTRSQQTRKHFLIATICPTFFSPAPLRAILIGTPSRLEIDLTHSQQTRKHFLIGTIRPTFTFTFAPLLTHHWSLITRHRLTSFLFDTNKSHKIIVLASLPMKTKEKQLSIRYKFAPRKMLRFTVHQSPLIPSRREPPKPASNIRSPLPRKLLFLPLTNPQRAI